MKLSPTSKNNIISHAKQEFPREACGLVIIKNGRQKYIPCRNLAHGTDNFILCPNDYMKADSEGEIVAVIHSHPNLSCKPSQADLVACESSGLPWFIVGLPSEEWSEIEPNGYKAPLIGREWSHGVLDCYTIIKDYYSQELGLDIPNFERSDEWWNRGENLYVDNFSKAGFYKIKMEELQVGDVIIMCVASSVPNHGAIYLGNNQILHHVHGRLSSRDVYGGYWLKHSVLFLRHEKNHITR